MIKLIDILKEIESNKILVPRRFEGRKEKMIQLIQDKIQQYSKNEKGGDLDLSGNFTTSLPDNLKVKGNLNLFNTQIDSLPKGLEVEGSLNLADSSILSLSSDLKVGVDLNLEGTSITSLPDNLKIKGNLNLYYTYISSLPKGLEVGGDVILGSTPIAEKYSEEQIKKMIEDKGGFIKGNIDI